MEKNGELSVPPVPGKGFRDGLTQTAWDSEILQSFTELNNITSMTFHDASKDDNYYDFRRENITDPGIYVGRNLISFRNSKKFENNMLPPHSYSPWYTWTKEGLNK